MWRYTCCLHCCCFPHCYHHHHHHCSLQVFSVIFTIHFTSVFANISFRTTRAWSQLIDHDLDLHCDLSEGQPFFLSKTDEHRSASVVLNVICKEMKTSADQNALLIIMKRIYSFMLILLFAGDLQGVYMSVWRDVYVRKSCGCSAILIDWIKKAGLGCLPLHHVG